MATMFIKQTEFSDKRQTVSGEEIELFESK